jgi:hypothetical protein
MAFGIGSRMDKFVYSCRSTVCFGGRRRNETIALTQESVGGAESPEGRKGQTC